VLDVQGGLPDQGGADLTAVPVPSSSTSTPTGTRCRPAARASMSTELEVRWEADGRIADAALRPEER
jgi:hypothetical protein